MSSAFLLKSFYLIESEDDVINSKFFENKYGTIIEDIVKDGYGKFYYPIYLTRTLLYPIIVIHLCDYPLVQIVLIITFIVLPVLFLLL